MKFYHIHYFIINLSFNAHEMKFKTLNNLFCFTPLIIISFVCSTPAVSGTTAATLGITNCPMAVIKHIISRTNELVSNSDPSLQMQIIRRIMEDIYGGNWGVLIVKEPELISSVIHWTFPDHRHRDGSAAFCLHVEHGWQYNVFKTGDVDTENRLTVEKVVEQLSRRNLLPDNHPPKKAAAAKSVRAKVGNDEAAAFTNSLIIDRN